MSFLAELQRRKVFKVGAAYVVAAWLAIQAASIALPTFEAPLWVLRVLILVIALGFPLTLLLAWALERTTEGVQVTAGSVGTKRMVAIAAALALLAFGWFMLGQPAYRADNAPAVMNRSIAVLPFVNMSADKDNEFFSDGLSETLLDMLAQVPDLKVAARTSSFAFKGRSEDMRKIGSMLGVANVLEGSVQKSGDEMRITAQLIRAQDGSHLWSKHFDRKLADVFKIQDEIATEVVRALQVALGEGTQQRLTQKRTENVAAYQEYLKALPLMPGRKVAELREAAQHFERAIELDPEFARAYVGAADAYRLLEGYGTVSAEEHARIGRYVERALALAPDLGEAHASLASSLQDTTDLARAEHEYQRAIELAPSYATAFQWYGELLSGLSRPDEALRMTEQAVALDPLSPVIQYQLAQAQANVGRIEDAHAAIARLVAQHPQYVFGHSAQATIAAGKGDLVGALRAMQAADAADPEGIARSVNRCNLFARFGAWDAARRCVAGFVERAPGQATVVSAQIGLAASTGDPKGALALAEQARSSDFGIRWGRAMLLTQLGRASEAVPLAKELMPNLLAEPVPDVEPPFEGPAILIGAMLMRSGAEAHGRALIERAIEADAKFGRKTLDEPWPWGEVFGREYLGQRDAAIAALQQRVAAGRFVDLPDVEADPLLAGLRADPRYEKIVAPARAKAAEQVRLAQAAGLL